MLNLFEVLLTLIIAGLFFRSEKPKLKFLFYGYLFFFVAMLIQFPFRYFELTLKETFEFALMSQVILAPFIISFSEITKYFAMNRFLKTRSFKNGIFFGIGWVSIESINFFSVMFFTTLLSIFSLEFDYTTLLNPNYGPLNFMFFFILNLSITIFVIKAITKRKKHYVAYAIIFSLVSYYGLLLLSGFEKYIFSLLILAFSTFVIFYYKIIK